VISARFGATKRPSRFALLATLLGLNLLLVNDPRALAQNSYHTGQPFSPGRKHDRCRQLGCGQLSYNHAKPDGLTIANWNSAFVLNQALGDPNVKFDARKFGWIGAPSKGIPVLVVMGFAGVKSFNEMLKSGKALKVGGTAPGSHSVDLPLMLNKMIGSKFNVVSGYQGTAQVRLAMQRAEKMASEVLAISPKVTENLQFLSQAQ
jgi:hypothetical protein